MPRSSHARLTLTLALVAGAALFLVPGVAWAQTRGLPWETPLQTVCRSITGPVAYAISLMGVVVAGASLVFGGEINEFVRRIIMLILVVSIIVGGASIMSTLFSGVSGTCSGS